MPWGLTRFHYSGKSHFVTFCCYHRPIRLLRCAQSLRAGVGLKAVRSGFLPFRQGHELVHDFLQSLQSPFLIGGSDHFLATLQVQAVGFTDLCDFFSQLSHALFDGLWHRDRLAELFTPWQSCFPTVLTVPVLAASLGN